MKCEFHTSNFGFWTLDFELNGLSILDLRPWKIKNSNFVKTLDLNFDLVF